MSSTKSMWGANARQKKTVVAVVLAVITAAMWARTLMKDAPAAARGQSVASVADANSSPGGASPEDQDHPLAASAGQVSGLRVDAPTSRPSVTVVLPVNSDRDLFALNAGYYPTKNLPISSPVTPVSPNPATHPTDEAEQARQQVLAAKANLLLEFTLLGAKPRARISGQVLGPGDKINGLTVKQIRDRQVELEMNGISVVLEQ